MCKNNIQWAEITEEIEMPNFKFKKVRGNNKELVMLLLKGDNDV